MKNKKQFETILYSTLGVVIMAIIVIALNVVVRPMVARVDLTEDKIYTLSDGTKRVLSKLDTPVQVRFYFSQSDPSMPEELKAYAARVEDLLNEYKLHAHGNLEIKKLDPVPDSEAEDSANLDGVEGQPVQGLGGDRIYFGLSVSCLDARTTIPFLTGARERLLEYDLTRAISQVVKPEKPTIGVMTGLPVFGQMNPMMMQMGRGGSEPWLFISELRADFTVKEVPLSAEKIDDDVNLLLVLYPKGISEQSEYAIDQFVLRGGKLIAFLDPFSIMDARNNANPSNPLQAAASGGASLDRLLKAWGLTFDVSHVVSDKEYLTELGGSDGNPQENVSFLQLPPSAMDTNDVVTSQIGRVFLPFCGAFSGTPAAGLKETVLMHSSENSELTDRMMAQFGSEKNFKPSGKQFALAVKLEGKFKTAFPEGDPSVKAPELEAGSTNQPPAKPIDNSLKESKSDNVVVLVGDSDMLHEQFYAQVRNFLGSRILIPFSQNLTFVQNVVEQLGGDQDLIAIRSRGAMTRPFTKVRELEAKAQDRFAAKIDELEKSESELGQKINALLQSSQPGQQVILSDDARKEWEQVQKKRAEVRDELRKERRNLRKETNKLQVSVQWTNILLMPAVVMLVGVTLAVVKRKKTASR